MTVEQVINHLSDNEYTLDELRNEVMSMLQDIDSSLMHAINSMNGD